MAIRLTVGTKEYVPVTVFDRTGIVDNLSVDATNIKFDVLYDDDVTFLYENQAATADVMTINCLLDLSATGPDGEIPDDTRLRLFVEFTVGSESPRLGPVVIFVRDEP